MKTSKFLHWIPKMLLTISLVLISCEPENDDFLLDDTSVNSNSEVLEKAALTYDNVLRYYSGGNLTVHSYKTQQSGAGVGIGNYEGIAFRTAVTTNNTYTGLDLNTYNPLLFLQHPQSKDFILTTSYAENASLQNKGWRNRNFCRKGCPIIQKRSGNGTVKLYRFYNAANSDHLFTKNYSEGVNAGYKFESVVGWVK